MTSSVREDAAERFSAALDGGDLDAAGAILDAIARLPRTAGLHLPECYGDLAQEYARRQRYDEAISAMQRAIDAGWRGAPDGRSDIAEFHLRAGRGEEAARLWQEIKVDTPDDVWLYNAAGFSYHEAGQHHVAVDWLTQGVELALRTGDPEGIVGQMSDARRNSLAALGRPLDELEQRVDPFLEQWRERGCARREGYLARYELLAGDENDDDRLFDDELPTEARAPSRPAQIALALAWFPAGDYECALERWDSLAEDWADIPHANYCQRIEGHLKWLRTHGAPVRAVAPITLDHYLPWCTEHGEDPEEARAAYAAHLFHHGQATDWPPGRNDHCWCGSGHKYKKCCGPTPAAVIRAGADADDP